MFHYFHDKVIPNLLKLVNSYGLTNNNSFASLIEDEEISEVENTPSTRKNQLFIKETGGSITKEYLLIRHGLRCVCSSTMKIWVRWIGFRCETRKKTTA